ELLGRSVEGDGDLGHGVLLVGSGRAGRRCRLHGRWYPGTRRAPNRAAEAEEPRSAGTGALLGVGDTGFEPVTSSVSGKRATAAPIARAALCGADGGGYGIRTRVHGFAGRCLASRPTHHECFRIHVKRRSRRVVERAAPRSGRPDSNRRPSPWQG